MKRRAALLTILVLILIINSSATVWRVSNRVISGITVDADFNTLQAAIDGATAGDVLYLEGSELSYGAGVFNKQLTVIGPGYWLSENANTQAIKETAKTGFLTFNAGSQGSIIQGLTLNFSISTGAYTVNYKVISINTDNITISKNYIRFNRFGTYTSGEVDCISIAGDRTDITIQQNWIEASVDDPSTNGYDGTVSAIRYSGIPSNCIIQNNFIRAFKTGVGGTYYAIFMGITDLTNDLNIYSNVIWGDLATHYSHQFNNILSEGSYLGSGDLMLYNLCDATQYPADAESNNLLSVDMSTVFVNYIAYIDNGYLLEAGSPAIGAGFNGGDCGVFTYDTGGYPYVLSGMPAIPAIYEATLGTVVGDNLPVTIKATSHTDDQ